MKALELLTAQELPKGFIYPNQFKRVVELGLVNLEPWYMLEGNALRDTALGLANRYPARTLVPFARRQDNDDIACWQSGLGEDIFVIHDFASAGWEQRNHFANFYEWLRKAIEDLVEFDV
jgi:hypothetical protein